MPVGSRVVVCGAHLGIAIPRHGEEGVVVETERFFPAFSREWTAVRFSDGEVRLYAAGEGLLLRLP